MRYIYAFTLFLSSLGLAVAQIPGVAMAKGKKVIDIPFERHKNFIVVSVLLQGVFPLKFIVDTGAEHTILAKKEVAQILGIPFQRSINLFGTDMQQPLKAYIARQVQLDLPSLFLKKDILVLDEDYFQLDKQAGLQIHGILGAEVFQGFVLKIDFVRQVLTVYEANAFKKVDHLNYKVQNIDVIKSRPYVTLMAQMTSDSSQLVKLMLDTGADLMLLLHTGIHSNLALPDTLIKGDIGLGLGGQIEGFLGRIVSLDFGPQRVFRPVCHFQELPETVNLDLLNGRNGIIGAAMLSHFHVIIDFAREKLYLKPNRFYKKINVYDKSGLTFVADGSGLGRFTVHYCLPNSPAAETGLQKEDELVSLNGLPAHWLSLAAINARLSRKSGYTIKLKIRRKGQLMSFKFKLIDYI